MARGKHAKNKKKRNFDQATQRLQQARTELNEQQELLQAAQVSFEKAEALSRQLHKAQCDMNEACSEELSRLERLAQKIDGHLTSIASDRKRYEKSRHQIWIQMMDAQSVAKPHLTSTELLEEDITRLSGTKILMLPMNATTGKNNQDNEMWKRIGLAKGERSKSTMDSKLSEAEKQYWLSVTSEDTIDVQFLLLKNYWSVLDIKNESTPAPNWLGHLTNRQPSQFDDKAIVPARPAQILTSKSRNDIARYADPWKLYLAWYQSIRTREIEMIENLGSAWNTIYERRPSDGIALSTCYQLNAIANYHIETKKHPEDPDAILSRTTIAALGSSTYWLPRGSTASYLESQPLSTTDIDELSMPQQGCFLMLGDPIIIEASDVATENTEHLRWLREAANVRREGKRSYKNNEVHSLATAGHSRPRLALAELQPGWQFMIEGFLMLGTDAGHVDDTFGWCLAVVAPSGNTLERMLVPASLEQTPLRNEILNLAAVLAWGHWRPDIDPAAKTLEGTHGRKDSTTETASTVDNEGSIMVLDVKATESKSASKAIDKNVDNEQSAHQVRPHLRRSHWRRQRYGANRALIKRVRVRAAIVGQRDDGVERTVYRLDPARLEQHQG